MVAFRHKSMSYTQKSLMKMTCPRCNNDLTSTYEEPMCIICGFVDYSYTQQASNTSQGVINSATQYVLRYIGSSPHLKETLVSARLRRLRHRIVHELDCPFCSSTMKQTQLSGKRRNPKEQRYGCDKEHRVSLLPTSDGYLGWK